MSLDELRIHLNKHKLDHQLGFPIHCQQQNCKSTFQSIDSYVKHFKIFHADDDLDGMVIDDVSVSSSNGLEIPEIDADELNREDRKM